MATKASQRCCGPVAGRLAATGCSASGVARGSRYRRSSVRGAAYGSTMAPVCGCARTIHITSGATTSCTTLPVHHTTQDGRSLRLMTLVDEFSRQCLAIKLGRRLNSMDVIETLADAMLAHGIPAHVR